MLPGFIKALVIGPIPVFQSAPHTIRVHRSWLEIHGVQHTLQLLCGVLPQQILVENDCAVLDLFDPTNGMVRPRVCHKINHFIPIRSCESFRWCFAYFSSKLPIAISENHVHWIAQQKHAAVSVIEAHLLRVSLLFTILTLERAKQNL